MMRDMVEQLYLVKDNNCAETTLRVINDRYALGLKEEDFKLVGGYGAGFGCGITCGVLAAGIAAIGKMTIQGRAHATEGFKELCASYVAAFKEKIGCLDCTDVKEKYFAGEERRCLSAVQLGADLFEQFAAEHGLCPAEGSGK